MRGPGSGDPLTLPRTAAPAARALEAAGIHDLRDLAGHSEREIAVLHGMGPKASAILRAALEAAGLAFRRERPGA